jgi:membrane protein DedA with SNARE-associated domain
MLLLASVTDSLVTFATHVIRDLGLGGIFLLVAADSLGIPIAAAAILLFAGFDVSTGHLSLVGVILAGTLGDLAGSLIAYAIGATGGHELLERHGRKLHITPAKLELAHRWFERRGPIVIAVGRLLPFVRTYIAYPAGVARMDIRRFAAATVAGGAVLSVAWALVGQAVGGSWTKWRHALGYVDVAVVGLLVLTAAWLCVRWYRTRGRPADAPA